MIIERRAMPIDQDQLDPADCVAVPVTYGKPAKECLALDNSST